MQYDRGQSTALVASDSSDRTRDKMDQKVKILYVNCIHCMLLYLVVVDDRLFDYTSQTLRRLAQNREAARKSRLRKKVCFSSFFLYLFSFLTNLFSDSLLQHIGGECILWMDFFMMQPCKIFFHAIFWFVYYTLHKCLVTFLLIILLSSFVVSP